MKDVIPSNLKSFNLLLLNSVLKLFKAMDPYALGILNRDKFPLFGSSLLLPQKRLVSVRLKINISGRIGPI